MQRVVPKNIFYNWQKQSFSQIYSQAIIYL